MDLDAPPPAAATNPEPAADPPADAAPDDAHAPPRRESKRLRERSAPVLVALPAHPRPDREPTPPDGRRTAPAPLFASKHYPASAHGDGRRSQHTHFPRLPPDHAPGPLPDGASASFSYRGPPQPPVPGAAPPVPPPPGGTPLVLDRERPAEFAAPSQQAVLANMLSQRIDQVDQLRTELAHAEARIASLSARSNPSAALRQAEARAEAAEARLAAIKDGWRGVESYLDMLSRREAEARAAFVRTLGTGEVGVPPSVPVFGAAPTSPYMPVRPPVPPNVPRAGPTFPALPPAPVVGGNPVIWRHESGHPRRRPADTDDAEPPHKRARPDRRGRDREREREVRKEKARFSDSPSPAPEKKDDADLSPPIAALNDDKDADADADADEEVDQIVDDVEMAAPTAGRPRRSSDTAATTVPAARAGSAGARSDGAVRDLKKDAKDATNGTSTDAGTTQGTTQSTTAAPASTTATTQPDDAMDAEGSPETDTDELSVDEELLKLSTKTRRRQYSEYDRHEYDRAGEYPRGEYARGRPDDYDRGRDEYERAHYARYGGPNAPGGNGEPRYHPGWYPEDAYYGRDGDYREPPHARPYPPPAPRGAEFAQRNGSGSGTSAPWYAHLKQGTTIATNTQGQRTCRQCGLAGRYKDGKCVEKWGPGPEGPGTVCDRCRKKMKRVERRGTADASMLASGLGPLPLHQHSFHSAPQTQSQSTQSQSQMSQTQLGTQYSPTRWNANGNGRYENGAGAGANGNGNGARYQNEEGAGGPGREKRYDLLPSHYGPPPSSGPEDEGAPGGATRRGGAKGRRREREPSVEAKEAPAAPAPAAPVAPAVEAQ